MAEGIQLEAFDSKFFCHHCRREVLPFHTPELICPDCSSGFLEEVSKDLFDAENTPQNGDYDEDESDLDEVSNLSFIPETIESVDSLISRMLMNVAENQSVGSVPSHYARPSEDETPLFNRSDSFSNIIRHVGMRSLLTESDGESDFMQLRFGGYGEYTVDDEVDALTSQLLDEVEVSGPPPLSKEQIKSLCVVSVSREQVEKGVQCTICMEDLSAREKVKSLPCTHLYHEKCITPWLERQATCPNCRDVVEIQCKSKRSRSCPRSRLRSGSSRFSEMSALGDYFTTSLNPFRFLN